MTDWKDDPKVRAARLEISARTKRWVSSERSFSDGIVTTRYQKLDPDDALDALCAAVAACASVPSPESPQGEAQIETHNGVPPIKTAYWRRVMALRHGCPQSALYGDDGELHCKACNIDFARMDAEEIEARWISGNLAILRASPPPAPAAPQGWYPQGFAAQLRQALERSGTASHVSIDRSTLDSIATMIEESASARRSEGDAT